MECDPPAYLSDDLMAAIVSALVGKKLLNFINTNITCQAALLTE